jgi:hypothetical protein
MLPTVRRYSQSTLYSMANLRDIMTQAMLRPRTTVTLRLDAHFLSLASPADGWYAGSVRRSFTSGPATFFYLENALQF